MPRGRRPEANDADAVPTVGNALSAFLRESGLDKPERASRLEAVWSRIVGPEILRQTRVLGLRKGVLLVGVGSSALMNDIQFHRAALLADLQREIRSPAIVGINFSLAVIREGQEGSDER